MAIHRPFPLPVDKPPAADPIRTGEIPNPAIVEASLRDVVRRYPQGGWQHERAIRLAFELGWRGRHELQRMREL